MTDSTAVEAFAAFAARTQKGDIPQAVLASARRRILDITGLQIAATALGTSQAAARFAADRGGRPDSTAIGVASKLPAAEAAFVNGVLAHSLDYDDTHLPSILHPSASVVPAAIAAAELADADGPAVLAAVAVGIELTIRLGMAGYDPDVRNSTFFEHGQHATSICGTVGSAVAAGMLLGQSEAQLCDTMGIAVSMASGVIEANRTGGTVKRLHCGWAAHAAVSAAQLAAYGFTGPPTALEGRFGFFQAFLHGTFRPEVLTDALGDTWAVPGVFFKPYPANHFTHTAIDAAIQLRDLGLTPGDVESAVLGVAAPTVRTIGEPLEAKRAPETGYQAQFSGPYVVAAALSGGSGLGLGLDDFTDELATDPARRALMARITVEADATCDEVFPYQFPAILRVVTASGERLEARVMTNRGGPQRPLSDHELTTKFRDNATRRASPAATADVETAVAALAGSGRAAPVLEPLRELAPLATDRDGGPRR